MTEEGTTRDPLWTRKLQIEVDELRLRVEKLKRQRNRARVERDDLRRETSRLREAARRRIVRIKLMTPGSDDAPSRPLVTRMVALPLGMTESVKLHAHVRPENPALDGYFITTDVYVEVVE